MKVWGEPGPLETQAIKEALDEAREAAGALRRGRMPGALGVALATMARRTEGHAAQVSAGYKVCSQWGL